MFFQDHEKRIYSPPSGGRFDPLALDRALVRATQGRLPDLLAAWQYDPNVGDISVPRAERELQKAAAEEELLAATRAVFGLKESPDCLDAEALECLCHFLDYMEKKGSPGGTRPSSPGTSDSAGWTGPTNGSCASTSTPSTPAPPG